jgi:hypothetical protein
MLQWELKDDADDDDCKTEHALKESELFNIIACIIYYHRVNSNGTDECCFIP